MKILATISALILTLIGAYYLSGDEPVLGSFGWWIYDNATTGGFFLCSLQWIAFYKHLNNLERFILSGFSLYCFMDFLGNILDINEHGNRYPYFYAAVLVVTFIALIIFWNKALWQILKKFKKRRLSRE